MRPSKVGSGQVRSGTSGGCGRRAERVEFGFLVLEGLGRALALRPQDLPSLRFPGVPMLLVERADRRRRSARSAFLPLSDRPECVPIGLGLPAAQLVNGHVVVRQWGAAAMRQLNIGVTLRGQRCGAEHALTRGGGRALHQIDDRFTPQPQEARPAPRAGNGSAGGRSRSNGRGGSTWPCCACPLPL